LWTAFFGYLRRKPPRYFELYAAYDEEDGEELMKAGKKMRKPGSEVKRAGEKTRKTGEKMRKPGSEVKRAGQKTRKTGKKMRKAGS
jgi:hypothetical protein